MSLQPVPSRLTFSIRELCAEFDVTPRTLRFYETKGLLRPARDGRGRVYSANDRARLALILRGKRVGFSLDEIGEMLDLHEMDPNERGALAQMRDKLHCRLADLRRQRADIEHAIEDLEHGCEWLEARLADREPSEDLKSRAAAFEALARSFINGDGAAAVAAED
ncbi:MAG: MerR family DNA-binding transcriptional regulator [Maricaulaceae bacterium]|jgi:DNA-binding transcriptional MerR regulator